MSRRFRDRAEAGQLLARRLAAYAGRADVRILALPRGGVPVAFAVARALQVPLDVQWYGNWDCPARRSWRWARSPPVGCAC